jgi:hypothetical protein
MCRTYARFDGWGLVLERRIAEEHIKRYGEGCGGYVASEFWIWTLTTAMAGLVFACLSKKEGSHEFCILESRERGAMRDDRINGSCAGFHTFLKRARDQKQKGGRYQRCTASAHSNHYSTCEAILGVSGTVTRRASLITSSSYLH